MQIKQRNFFLFRNKLVPEHKCRKLTAENVKPTTTILE